MSIDLIPRQGRIAAPLELEIVRELTADDLRRIATTTSDPMAGPPILQKLRATHHKQAILLARGHKPIDVAMIVGSSPERVRQLLRDPAFRDLVAQYQDSVITSMLDDSQRIAGKLTDLSELAIDELHERMDDPAKRAALPTAEVRKIGEFASDRSVAPPKTTAPANAPPAEITINFGTQLHTPAKAPGDGAKVIEPDEDVKP